MKNHNRKSLSPYRELFDHGTWGGAWGDYLLMGQEVEGYFQFWRKTHIFKATGGAIMGGRMEGRPKWGAIFGIHGGAMRGRSTLL